MILGILDKIASDTSKNFKLEVLKENAENALFKKTVQMAYCPVTQYYIKQIPEVTEFKGKMNLETGLQALTELSSRAITGNEAKRFLADVLGSLTEEDATVLKRVVLKDLRAGFSESSINKAMGKGTIKETPYMGAVSYSEKKVLALFKKYKKVFSEVKMDGRYSNVKITDEIYMESRGGKPTPLGGVFDNLVSFKEFFTEDVVLNGELIIPGMDRYASNGAIASLISITSKLEEGKNVDKEVKKFNTSYNCTLEEMSKRIVLVAWDYIPLKNYDDGGKFDVARDLRMDVLKAAVENFNAPNLKFVEYREVTNVAEAMAHFKELLNAGEEGTILKGGEAPWKDGKPTFQVKFKLEMTVDLEIIGFNYGTKGTKNEHLISSVNVSSSCGLLTTSPAGITEKMMKHLTENQATIKGGILEVKCSGLSSNSDGAYALLHPVFSELRTDKNNADSLLQIQENENMIKELK